jgi:hypothetical protein
MGMFNLFRQKEPDDFALRADLVELVKKRLIDRANRIRAEDAICAAAAIVGERCIDASGDFSLREHTLVPGSRVFSNRVNELLCGDTPEAGPDAFPSQSVYGILRDGIDANCYRPDHFPLLASVFGGYAAGIGKEADWGKVPVTVLPRNHPTVVPLQFAYETRDKVDAILHSLIADKMRCLTITTKTLAALLNLMVGAIEPEVALRLAFEITNGMAKTAPMTKTAFKKAQAKV